MDCLDLLVVQGTASVRSILFLSFIVPIFAWNIPLVSLICLKRSLVFPILLFSSIYLHWSLIKAFLSLLAILWNSAFKWVYLFFCPLSFTCLLFSAICKASSDNYFAFLHFFFLGMVLITPSLFGWALNPSVLVRESQREVWDRQTVRRPHADRGGERSAAATGMLTACRGWKGKEGTLPDTFWRKQGLTDNDDIELLACRTGREYVSVILRHQVCGDFLWQPQETDTQPCPDTLCPFILRLWQGVLLPAPDMLYIYLCQWSL